MLVFAAVMSPPVQTWYVRRVLERQPEWRVSVDSVFASFSKVEISGLRIERAGTVITAPNVELELPVWRTLRDRRLAIQRLVAKDWTVKFPHETAAAGGAKTGMTGATTPADAAGAAQSAHPTANAGSGTARGFGGELSGWALPWPIAIDELALEGDVLSPQDETTSSLHIAATGGGLGAGRTAKLAVTAKAYDARLPENAIAVQADLELASDDGRTVRRVAATGGLASGAGTKVVTAGAAAWNFRIEAERTTSGENYRVAVERDGRSLAELRAGWDAVAGRFTGEWRADLRDGDAAALGVGPLLPAVVEGAGEFSAAGDFGKIAASGRLKTAGQRWPAAATWLAALGPTTLAAEFDAEREGSAVRFRELALALDGVQPIAAARAVQPFEVALADGSIRTTEPAKDWLEVELRAWPLAWLQGVVGPAVALEGGPISGRVGVGGDRDGLRVRALTPLKAESVSLRRDGRTVLQGATVEAKLAATAGPEAGMWQFDFAPLTLATAGRQLVRFEGKLTLPGNRGEQTNLTGRWSADLVALKTSGATPGLGWLAGKAANGEVKGTLGGYADLEVALLVSGVDQKNALNGTVRAYLYGDGTVAFSAPLTLTFGGEVSDLNVEWEWRADAPRNGVDLKLKAKKTTLAHLQRLGAPLAALGGAGAATEGRTRAFWGDWLGRVRFDFDRMQLADREVIDVGGFLKVAPDRVELLGGHGGPAEHTLTQIEGALTFAAGSAARPYALSLTMAPYRIDSDRFLGKARKKGDEEDDQSFFKGRFEVERSIRASGGSVAELIAQREEEFKLTSTNGIVRMLKTGVAQALPSAPDRSGAVNALDNVGTGFLRLLGANTKSLGSGQVKVGATTEAVLDFDSAMAEIGYDRLTITAVQHATGAVTVPQFELTGTELHLAGSGALGGGADAAWAGRPLTAELTLAVKGRLEDLLTKAGLLSGKKDAAGYATVEPAIKAGGTLGKPTFDEWRARLAAAGAPKSDAKKAK